MPGRSRITAAFALVMLVVGQISVFVHEAAVQHVTCVEHGEQVEVAKAGRGRVADDGCGSAHWTGVDGDGTRGAEHEHCTLAQALRAGTLAASSPPLAHIVLETSPEAALPSTALAHASDLLLIAPKTSPPHAS